MKFRRIIPVTMLTIALAIGSCGTLYADGRTSDEVIRKAQPKPAGYDASYQKKSKYDRYNENFSKLEASAGTTNNNISAQPEVKNTVPAPSVGSKPNSTMQTQQPATSSSQKQASKSRFTYNGDNDVERELNLQFIEDHKKTIVAAAKLALDNHLTDYGMSFSLQDWKIGVFDENNTVFAYTTVTFNNESYIYYYVGTLNTDENGKVLNAKHHLVVLGDYVFWNDGYCADFLATMAEIFNSYK